ncbi:MAG TPA: hypothetical protein VGR35_14900 [Tepidisphaeraceae bacterium]|nr:hypothetical protein [Tepidisphaeraceae bacterium]
MGSRARALGLSAAELRRWDDPAAVEDRELVAEKLRDSKVLVGKTSAEVIRLLGPPQTTDRFQLDYLVGVVAVDYVFMIVILDGEIVAAVTVTLD